MRFLPSGNRGGKCPRCRDKKLSGLYSALPYKEKQLTKKLIYQFKYQPYTKELAKSFAEILSDHFMLSHSLIVDDRQLLENGVLVPVPLHKSKLKERGYNQSEELAKELSKTLNIPVATDILIRTKKTLPQISLSGSQRQENIKGAFAINKNCRTPEVLQFSGKKVFLVDDVYTTGSTMEECANVLRTSGAKQVWGICIAREG